MVGSLEKAPARRTEGERKLVKIPKADVAVSARFESLIRREPGLEMRPMFGQPAAFLSGHLCVGVFGSDLFFRLGPEDRETASRIPGARAFEPMPGRAMREYVVLPESELKDKDRSRVWLERAVRFARTLPKKTGSGRTPPTAKRSAKGARPH